MIKIIRGVYGFVDEGGIVRPKTSDDAPFSLLPEQEERLVRLGVAQYVVQVKSAPAEEPQPEESVAELPSNERLLSDLSAKELRELGKEYGITFKVGISKAEMVQAIETAENELEAAGDNEPAPVFDASEAVQ